MPESLETISYQLDNCLGVLDELQDSIEVKRKFGSDFQAFR